MRWARKDSAGRTAARTFARGWLDEKIDRVFYWAPFSFPSLCPPSFGIPGQGHQRGLRPPGGILRPMEAGGLSDIGRAEPHSYGRDGQSPGVVLSIPHRTYPGFGPGLCPGRQGPAQRSRHRCPLYQDQETEPLSGLFLFSSGATGRLVRLHFLPCGGRLSERKRRGSGHPDAVQALSGKR